MLCVLARSAILHKLAAQPARKANSFAFDIGAYRAPHFEGARVVAEFDSDSFKDGVGVVLDDLQLFVGDQLVRPDLTFQI